MGLGVLVAVGLGVGVAVRRGVGVAVRLGVRVAVGLGAATALELFILRSVSVPTLPSSVRLFALWKAFTAFSVAVPNEPSTLPV